MSEKKKEEGDKKSRLGIVRLEKEVSLEKKIEKRMHPRFLLNLPIEYYHLDLPVSYSSDTINISEGGLMICLGERLEGGQHLNLKIFCSSGSTLLTIEAMVQVIWADAHLGKDGNYRHGVKFVGMTPEDLQNFKGFLDSLSPHLILGKGGGYEDRALDKKTKVEGRKLTRPDYFPNTFFKRSVVCATGLVLIFCSSCPTM